LVVKTKHMRACQEDYALDSLVLHATVFLFNCVSPNIYCVPTFQLTIASILLIFAPQYPAINGCQSQNINQEDIKPPSSKLRRSYWC